MTWTMTWTTTWTVPRPAIARRLVLALGLAIFIAPWTAAAAAKTAVDLELVLAVDVSGSVDFEEAALQRDGYVAAGHREPGIRQGRRRRRARSHRRYLRRVGR
jgi:hypothetical protein